MMSNILPAEDWIYNPYYCGEISRYLYPFWRDRFIEINSGKISEVILTGSIGGGKTYFGNVLLLRKFYELACMGSDMWDILGLARGSAVFFVYFSISMRQAKFTGYQELLTMIDNTPFFKERFPRDKTVDSYIRFPNNIFIVTGSKLQHQIGLNILGSVLDEANFRLERDKFESAFSVYTAIVERRLSRFAKGGSDLGMSLLISSSMDTSSFVETRIAQVEKNENVRVIRVAGVDLKRDMGTITEHEDDFVVFTGEGYLSPKIVLNYADFEEIINALSITVKEDWKDKDIKTVVAEEEILSKWFRIVPKVFRDSFETNIVRAVRDVLGVSTGSDNKLMKSVSAVDDATDRDNIFLKEVIELSMFDEVRIQDFFDISKIADKEKARYIHCDLALGKGDKAGISCSYIESVKKDDVGRMLPVVRVEWMVGIDRSLKNRIDDEIPLWKIRDFLLWLKDKKINIQKISFDSFQSADMIQLLQRAGLGVEKLSVDVTDEPYLNLVNLYLERRIKHCQHSLYRKELLALEWNRIKRKVDHPFDGSKDVADSVCGSVWLAINNFSVGNIMIDEFADYSPVEVLEQEDVLDLLFKEAKKNRKGNWWERGL